MTPPSGVEVVPGPSASCSVDAEGRITVKFAGTLGSPPGTGGSTPSLMLRLRPPAGKPGHERLLNVPLARADDCAHWRAVLAPGHPQLAEGRWDLYLRHDDDAPWQRLTPGIRDLRTLLDGHPAAGTSPLAVRIPYTTQDGYLALRAWLRPAHAEVGAVVLEGRTMTVTARLLGARLDSGAAALLRLRGDEGTVREVDLGRRDGDGFSFTCDLGDLGDLVAGRGGRHEVWDVFMRPGTGARRVRMGRLLDDVADKKNIFTFPEQLIGGARIRPYYTVDNDLAVDVAA